MARLDRQAVVNLQVGRRHRRPRGGRGRLRGGQFRRQLRLMLAQGADPALVPGDVLLQLRLGGDKALFGLIDGEHDGNLLLLEAADGRLRGVDLVGERLILVVLSHLALLRPVFRHLLLGRLDLEFELFLLGLEPEPLGLRGLDRRLLRGDPRLHGGHLAGHALQLLFEPQPLAVAFLKHEQFVQTGSGHRTGTVRARWGGGQTQSAKV
ncbi:MAG: hypothetical protein HYV75_06790 [Opitutae bacterium]|nr:hypothetical protein [Opitutae bacterium]